MSRSLVAALTIAALVASGCADDESSDPPAPTTSESVETATTTTATNAPPDEDPLPLQTVQDFVIHFDLSKVTEGEPRSFYDAVLDRAAQGAGEPVALHGDATFTPVDSLDGQVVDVEGAVLPSISLDFGLLSLGEAWLDWTKASLAAELTSAGEVDLAEVFESSSVDEPPLLVEIATADLSQRRTHIGPGDRSAVDLSFVDGLVAGDELRSLHLFGVTLPGDPKAEADLNSLDLFTYRWNEGLVRVLGNGTAPRLGVDDTLRVVEEFGLAGREPRPAAARRILGSSPAQDTPAGPPRVIVTREFKESAAAVGFLAGSTVGSAAVTQAIGELSGDNRWGTASFRSGLWNLGEEFRITRGGEYGYDPNILGVEVRGEANFQNFAYVPASTIAGIFGAYEGLRQCSLIADAMNTMNAEGGLLLDQFTVDSMRVTMAARAVLELTGEDPGDAFTPADDVDPLTAPPGPIPTCRPPPPPFPGFPPSPVGGTFGDVHLRTFDGRVYDSQAVGEFLLFDNGVATVQMRAEPWQDHDSVSVATAFAFRVGDRTVSVHHNGDTWIDGEPADLTRGLPVDFGGGQLLRSLGGWVIEWPDGTAARVRERSDRLLVIITPAAGPTRAMVGDNDGDPDNDFTTPSGEVLPADLDDDFDRFYADFVDTWRIAPGESLFHYDAGEDSTTFTIAGFPASASPVEDVEPARLTEAEQICRVARVTTDALRDACVLDVAVTGEAGFAYDAFFSDVMISTFDGSAEDDPVPTGDAREGESLLTIGDQTILFGDDPPVVDPTAARPLWQCQADDESFFAYSRFQETPTRQLEVDIQYSGGNSDGRLSVVVKLNGENYAWLVSYDEAFLGAVDDISLTGDGLRVTGSAFFNADLDPAVFPGVDLTGREFDPFTLVATCGG
jgi:hypothetical protein